MNDLLDSIPDLIWQKDVDGFYFDCNDAFARFYGATKAEIIGKKALNFFPPDVASTLLAQDIAVLETGEPQTSDEWVIRPSDGCRLLFETKRTLLVDETGSVIGILGIARDITERYEAQRDADLFWKLVEFSGDPIYILDPLKEYRMRHINQAACKHFGMTKAEVESMTVFDWDPDITQEKLDDLWRLLREEGAVLFETRHRKKTGEIVPVEVSANLLLMEGSEFAAGYIRDISEQKKAEKALRQSHKHLMDITSNVPGIVYEFQRTAEGQYGFLFMGETAHTMFGVRPEEICKDIGLMNSLVHPDDLDGVFASIEESAQTLQNWQKEFRVVLPDSDLRWLLGSSKPEKQDNGAIIWCGYFTDISKIKHAENALKESQELLRKLIAHQDHIREKERKQAAKELHDELAQHLLAIKIDLSLLPRNVGASNMLMTTVEEIVERVDAMIKSTREIMNNLRPSVLDLGLYAALDWQTKEFERKSGIACSLTGKEDELQLEEQLATALFRIMQGALAGIQHQGQTTQVTVSLKRRESDVVMTVTDDSVLDVINGADQIEHFGMVGINERIGMFGGSAKVTRNEHDGGAVLSISIPLKAQTQPRLL